MDTREYLGDGVYASHDGYQIVLLARRLSLGTVEDAGGPIDIIYLDPDTYANLVAFAHRVFTLPEEDENED